MPSMSRTTSSSDSPSGGEDVVAHLVLDGFGEGVDARLGFGERGLGALEVELDFAGGGEDGGVDVGERFVDGGGAGVDGGLRDEGHAQLAAGEEGGGKVGGEARLDLLDEERLEFFGRAGEQDDDAACWPSCRVVEVLAGGAAVGVGQQGGAVEDVGLLAVVGRHGDAALGEALGERR